MPGLLFLDDANSTCSSLAEAIARDIAWNRRLELEVWSAGAWPAHVRPEVREVLAEARFGVDALRSKSVLEVDLDEIDLVVCLSLEARDHPLPSRLERLSWLLPDPSSAPPGERLEAFRAARDELERRIERLFDARWPRGDRS